MGADASGLANLTQDTALDASPAWSPNGTQITFSARRDGVDFEIYVMNAEGTIQDTLTNNSADDTAPAWSPDGTSIAFTTDRDGNREVYVMDADGSNPVDLTLDHQESDRTRSASDPSWSPDGTQIVYQVASRLFFSRIYVMNSDGSNPVQLTSSPASDFEPAWSP